MTPPTPYRNSEDIPLRPELYDSAVLGLLAGKVLEASGRTAYAERGFLTTAFETQIHESQELDMDDLRTVVQDFFKAQGWKWGKRLDALLETRNFFKLLIECHDQVIILWVEGYEIRPKVGMKARAAFIVDGARYFGTVRWVDTQRGLYALEVDEKNKPLLASTVTLRKRGKFIALVPWEIVEAALVDLKRLN